MEAKKHLIILVLRILETQSDEDHPITQSKITELIRDAGYPCDRKTVGRNIRFLTEIGYPIIKTAKGAYMDRKMFTREEIDLVLSLVAATEHEGIDKDSLVKRLRSVLDRYYKRKRG